MKWIFPAAFVAYFAVLIGAAVHDRHLHREHDKCVVCHPSGKLAMWGECE